MIFSVDANGKVIPRDAQEILVNSEADLANITDPGIVPGSLAYTAGYAQMWQKSESGEWVAVEEA